MRKSVIILIVIIFVASIVVVNFFGMKMSVYKTVVNVERIECLNQTDVEKGITVTQNNTGKTVINVKYTTPANKQTLTGTMLQLDMRAYPDNATNKNLDYIVSSTSNLPIEIYKDDNGQCTGLILFYGTTKAFDLTVRSTDNSNVSFVIKIKAA